MIVLTILQVASGVIFAATLGGTAALIAEFSVKMSQVITLYRSIS